MKRTDEGLVLVLIWQELEEKLGDFRSDDNKCIYMLHTLRPREKEEEGQCKGPGYE